jgi:hypothetical protein
VAFLQPSLLFLLSKVRLFMYDASCLAFNSSLTVDYFCAKLWKLLPEKWFFACSGEFLQTCAASNGSDLVPRFFHVSIPSLYAFLSSCKPSVRAYGRPPPPPLMLLSSMLCSMSLCTCFTHKAAHGFLFFFPCHVCVKPPFLSVIPLMLLCALPPTLQCVFLTFVCLQVCPPAPPLSNPLFVTKVRCSGSTTVCRRTHAFLQTSNSYS